MNIEAEQQKQVLIGYHANCIDGFTAAWACWKGLMETTSVLSENISFEPLVYGDIELLLEVAKAYDTIYIVDFSLTEEAIAKITEYTRLVIIDHHKTAFEHYGIDSDLYPSIEIMVNGANIILDTKECGASLAWIYFFGKLTPIPKLIQYVRDYDLWQFKLKYTEEINKALRLEQQSPTNWELVHDLMEINIEHFISRGIAIQEYHSTIVKDIVKEAYPIKLNGISGLIANCSPHFASNVGHELAKLSGTFGATWQRGSKRIMKVSLRSIEDFDVSAIAKNFGGGGHKNAAGFYIPTDQHSLHNAAAIEEIISGKQENTIH